MEILFCPKNREIACVCKEILHRSITSNSWTLACSGFFPAGTGSNNGSFIVMPRGIFFIFNGVSFDNAGSVGNAGSFYLFKSTDLNNLGRPLETRGQFNVGGYGTGSGSTFSNEEGSIVINRGSMTNYDFFFNDGIFENHGTLYNRPIGHIFPLFNNTGLLNNNEETTIHNWDDSELENLVAIRNFGTLNNLTLITNKGPDAVIINECNGTFNSEGVVLGNSVTESCPSGHRTHLPDSLLSEFSSR